MAQDFDVVATYKNLLFSSPVCGTNTTLAIYKE